MNDKLLIDRTLLEQALDALLHRRSGSDQVQRIDAAITDLCAALAQQPEPAQEPADPTEYDRRNPLGGPAARFEGIAARLRAGEPYDEVLRDFGIKHIEDDPPRQAPAEREAVFRAGAKTMFDALLYRVANNWHPRAQAERDAQNGWATEWAVDALDEVSPDDCAKWKSIQQAWDDGFQAGKNQLVAAQPEPAQEPVGEMRLSEIIDGMVVPAVPAELPVGTKLYAAPQPQRPPLTDAEMLDLIDDAMEGGSLLDLVRATERKVRGETE